MILDYQSFGCFYCDKKFATQNQVENHEKIHTGEKSVALDSPKSLENDLETFKLPKNHGNQFIPAFQPSVKNEGSYNEKEVTNGTITGKSFSEALILASVNPQYDKRLFIEFLEKYMFRTCCVHFFFF